MQGPTEREALLEHPIRAAIVSMVWDRPGITVNELRSALKVKWGRLGTGTLLHHLYRLERAAWVTSRRSGHHRRIYAARGPWGDPTVLCALQRTKSLRLAQALAQDGPMNPSELQLVLGAGSTAPATRQTVGYHLRFLRTHGLVVNRRDGRKTQYEPTPRLRELLHMLGSTGVPSRSPALSLPGAFAAPGPSPSTLDSISETS